MKTAAWTNENAAKWELEAALKFWREFRTTGSRRRLRAAIQNFRRYH